jgi:hypothetical protein
VPLCSMYLHGAKTQKNNIILTPPWKLQISWFVGMFIIYVHTKFHKPSCNGYCLLLSNRFCDSSQGLWKSVHWFKSYWVREGTYKNTKHMHVYTDMMIPQIHILI